MAERIVERFRSLDANLDAAAETFTMLGEPGLGSWILVIARMGDDECYKNLMIIRDKWANFMEECEHCFSLIWCRFVEELLKEKVK